MGRFRVDFKISRKKVGFKSITVDTESPAIDPTDLGTREEIRRAIAPDYDVLPELVELLSVKADNPTGSGTKMKKEWHATVQGQDKHIEKAVASTPVNAGNIPTGSVKGHSIPTLDQLRGATIDQLRLAVEAFDLTEKFPNYKSQVSSELAPLLANHFYPGSVQMPGQADDEAADDAADETVEGS